MSDVPEDLRYSESHEWVREEDDGTVTIGITDHAQAQLGDLVFVELPPVGSALVGQEEFGVVESVKAASDLYAPLGGRVVAVNENLRDAPELVNQDPYGDGWLVKLEPGNAGELDSLLGAAAYRGVVEADEGGH